MFKLNFDIKKHFLENGLEVLTIKKDTQISAINLGVKVGAMYETKEEKGISHFVEHMLFKGTKTRKNEIPHLLSQEDALLRKKFFDYLFGQASQKKYHIYVDTMNQDMQK